MSFKNLYNSVADTYARYEVEITGGKSATCTDINGKEYIDFTSGIGVNSLGFCDDDWSAAVAAQASILNHTSNLYYTAPGGILGDTLTAKTGYKKVFFANSGAEANEGAIKAARKYSFDKYGEGRHTIISLINSFHGRTLTALTATGQPSLQLGFTPLTPGFKYVPCDDITLLESALDDSTCAVMLEYIQGEGGVNPLDWDYVTQLFELCAQRDMLVIADEVQTGIGRTGKILCGEYYGVQADITTLAKGLGGGLPIGAILFNEKTAGVLGYGNHGSTFGGNPIVCAGAKVVMDKLSSDGFLNEVTRKGEALKKVLEPYGEITGKGMMLGLKLENKTAPDVLKTAIKKGLLVLTAKDKLRFLPPLNISQNELDKGIWILTDILG